MNDDRKPSEDLKEGLSLIFRAARGAVKRVDMAKIDKGLDKAVSGATRVATAVGRAVSDEFNRISASPPWAKSSSTQAEPPKDDSTEGEVSANAPAQDPPPPQS